ncbi:hypothetical protein BCR34DRAFT_578464 [Clohesyomyces aquaticus]|uniref:Macro domain-like protein n=1 Tax=Clohesyomyces aquaticus TaxID=1231657 RepID=A0A1Y1YF91_9PLEO|nr:hypothetical protein BCR34DRAFT_578464 [Clohesyomyces aquaticus]
MWNPTRLLNNIKHMASTSGDAATKSGAEEISPSLIPSIHLHCMVEDFISAFHSAAETHKLPSSVSITIHHDRLADLSPSVKFDAIVSPANSYGCMNGGFDDALSRAFSPKDDYLALTRVVQAKLWTEWRGFAPPSSCTLVDLDAGTDEGDPKLAKNQWGCKYLALCPTMKVPQLVLWDREVVYECVWALLATVHRHNREVKQGRVIDGSHREIKHVLMTPLATGCGGWSPERWAAQTVLAMKHFENEVDSGPVERRSMMTFRALAHKGEVEATYLL